MKTRIRLNSSAIIKSSCDYRLVNIVFEGYKEIDIYNDTLYGSAVHKFISRMQETNGDTAEAIKAAKKLFDFKAKIRPKKEHLNENHLMATCLEYWEEYLSKSNFEHLINPLAECWKCNGVGCEVCFGTGHRAQPMVEQKFAIPVFEDETLVVEMCGTIDKIGRIKNGVLCVGDYKTTSSWEPAKYLRKYRLSPQLKMYVWAIKRIAAMNPDGPLKDFLTQPVGAFIEGIFLKSAKATEFHRSEVFAYKDEDLAEFESLLMEKVMHVIALYIKAISVRRNGILEGTCMEYGGCPFENVCAAPDLVSRELMFKRFFIQKPYDPLNLHEE